MTTREEILNDPSVHYFAKDIIRLTKGKDIVDCIQDLRIALTLLEKEFTERKVIK